MRELPLPAGNTRLRRPIGESTEEDITAARCPRRKKKTRQPEGWRVM